MGARIGLTTRNIARRYGVSIGFISSGYVAPCVAPRMRVCYAIRERQRKLAAMAMNWDKAKARKPGEAAFPTDKTAPGAWTHIPREPVRVMTDDEKRAFLASRPDLVGR